MSRDVHGPALFPAIPQELSFAAGSHRHEGEARQLTRLLPFRQHPECRLNPLHAEMGEYAPAP